MENSETVPGCHVHHGGRFHFIKPGLNCVPWLTRLLEELDCGQLKPKNVKEDNQGTLVWRNSEMQNAKHVSVRGNFV